MADRLGTLRDKYRASTRERLRKVCDLLRSVEGPSDNRVSLALGELHAVKGESSMVGFDVMSRLAHAVETYVSVRRSAGDFAYREVADAIDSLVGIFEQPYAALLQEPAIGELLNEIEAALPNAPSRAPVGTEPSGGQVALPASAPATGSEESSESTTESNTRYTRVDASRIDGLCDAIADVTLKLGRFETDFVSLTDQLSKFDELRPVLALRQRLESLRREFDGVASSAWALRLVQVAPSLDELANYGFTLAKSLDKDVAIQVHAPGVELERNVLDELNDPLIHMIRNAIDHGIESSGHREGKSSTARLRLSAEMRGASVLILIEDDGVGLDAAVIRERAVALGLVTRERASLLTESESLELIFLDRFTQRDTVTNLSGRGVGLSAARRKVEAIGGAIRVESRKGHGAQFEILVPSTLSRERVLLVEAANTLCCIPARWVLTVVGNSQVVAEAKEKNYLSYQGHLMVVRSIANWMSLEPGSESSLVVVDIASRDGAFLVDRVLGQRDILRLSADPILGSGQRIEASGMLDDGKVVLFLRWAEALRTATERRVPQARGPLPAARASTVLVVDDSPVIRDIVSEVLTGAGLKVVTAENGLTAKRYLESNVCDLVVSDVEMPEMSGLELLEHIRKSNDTLPVIILTTRSSPESRRRAASLGANAYIVKSEFRGNVLLDVVRQFVELAT